MAPTLHLSDDTSTDRGANTPAAMPSLTHVPGLGDMNPLLLSDNAGIAVASHSPIPPIPPSFSAASTVDASQQMNVANLATAKNPSQASLTHVPEAASAVVATSGIDDPTNMTHPPHPPPPLLSAATPPSVDTSIKLYLPEVVYTSLNNNEGILHGKIRKF